MCWQENKEALGLVLTSYCHPVVKERDFTSIAQDRHLCSVVHLYLHSNIQKFGVINN